VATLFTLSDELLLEPELLDLWRGRTAPRDDLDDDIGADEDDRVEARDGRAGDVVGRHRERRHLRLVGGSDDRPTRLAPPSPPPDPLAELLRTPEGTTPPDVGELERIDVQLPKSRDLASVLRDAIGNLRIDWD
jgi:hypothetical protein